MGKKSTTKSLVIAGMCIALVLVATAFINIRLPVAANGGLIHLGNVPLFIAAMLFGKNIGAAAGGIGMALFDLLSGWTVWAPFTFIIVGMMGYVVGWMSQCHQNSFYRNAAAIMVACIIKVGGYYIAEGIIYGNWIVPMSSIPGNLVQIAVAAVIVLPMIGRLKNGIRE